MGVKLLHIRFDELYGVTKTYEGTTQLAHDVLGRLLKVP